MAGESPRTGKEVLRAFKSVLEYPYEDRFISVMRNVNREESFALFRRHYPESGKIELKRVPVHGVFEKSDYYKDIVRRQHGPDEVERVIYGPPSPAVPLKRTIEERRIYESFGARRGRDLHQEELPGSVRTTTRQCKRSGLPEAAHQLTRSDGVVTPTHLLLRDAQQELSSGQLVQSDRGWYRGDEYMSRLAHAMHGLGERSSSE